MLGISFAGGLSIVAAGRPSVRNKVVEIISLGDSGNNLTFYSHRPVIVISSNENWENMCRPSNEFASCTM